MKQKRFEWYNELCYLNERKIELGKRFREYQNEFDKKKVSDESDRIYERIVELRQRLQETK